MASYRELRRNMRFAQQQAATTFEYGTRVAFSRAFLRSTAQFTGHDAPTHSGPFARGTVKAVEPFGARSLVFIHWDDGHAGKVLDCNLVRVDRIHLEPV